MLRQNGQREGLKDLQKGTVVGAGGIDMCVFQTGHPTGFLMHEPHGCVGGSPLAKKCPASGGAVVRPGLLVIEANGG